MTCPHQTCECRERQAEEDRFNIEVFRWRLQRLRDAFLEDADRLELFNIATGSRDYECPVVLKRIENPR